MFITKNIEEYWQIKIICFFLFFKFTQENVVQQDDQEK